MISGQLRHLTILIMEPKMANEGEIYVYIFSLVYFVLFLLVIGIAFAIYRFKLHYKFLFKVSGVF